MIKKILVIRTDRIGEVLLTTPILAALKEAMPDAKVSMMVRPEVKELVEDNPNVSEIIEYKGEIRGNKGKEGVIREKKGTIRKAFRLKRIFKEKDFDIAIIVNPKKEFHLAVFLAKIPIRVGFDRKWGFLLTHKVKDLKYMAEKHEVEYNLDLVRILGIEPKDKKLVLVVRDTDIERGINKEEEGKIRINKDREGEIWLEKGQQIIAIHPCTSNPKKQWPKEYFAKLGDLLIESGYNVAIVSGPDDILVAKEVISMMKNKTIDLSGRLTLKELAVLFKKCKFLVSGDSGPVHIAAAVGTPVVAIFGKQDPGSRPERWGPWGKGHIVIQKDRLEDIKPEEVFNAIKNAHTNS